MNHSQKNPYRIFYALLFLFIVLITLLFVVNNKAVNQNESSSLDAKNHSEKLSSNNLHDKDPLPPPESISKNDPVTYPLNGRVIDNYDKPVCNAAMILDNHCNSHTILKTITNESGDFQFKSLPAGNYTLSATAPNFFPGEPLRIIIPVIDPVNCRLIQMEKIKGRVLSLAGQKEITGATVTIIAQQPDHKKEISGEVILGTTPAFLPQITDNQGNFIFTELHPGFYDLQIEANSFFTHRENHIRTNSSNLDIRLNKTATLDAEVTDQFDKPILLANVALSLIKGNGIIQKKQYTAQNGLCTISGLQPGIYKLEASAENYRKNDNSTCITELVYDQQKIKLILQEILFSISGHVKENDSNRPVPGISIVAAMRTQGVFYKRYSTEDAQSPQAKTDETGFYQIKDLSRGEFLLRESRIDLNRQPYSLEMDNLSTADGRNVTIADHDVTDIDFTAVKSTSISGHILDPTGNPINQALVQIKYMGRELDLWTAQSNEKGEYSLQRLPGFYQVKETKLRVTASHPEYGGGQSQEILYSPGKMLEGIDVILSKGGTGMIKGTVRCGENPVKKEFYKPVFYDQEGLNTYKANKVEDGSFTFENIPFGDGELSIESDEYENDRYEVILSKDSPVQQVTINLVKMENQTISGTVFDSKNRPLSNVSVRAVGIEARNLPLIETDSAGKYCFKGLHTAPYTLFFEMQSAPKYRAWLFGVQGGSVDVNVTLDFEPVHVTVHVIDKEGKPVLEDNLVCIRPSSTDTKAVVSETAPETGTFTIDIPSPGQYSASMFPSVSRKLQGSTSFEITRDTPKTMDINIVFSQDQDSVKIRGKFLHRDGSPVNRAVVTVQPIDSPGSFPFPQKLLGFNGEIGLLLKPGVYRLVFNSLRKVTIANLSVGNQDQEDLIFYED